DRINDALVLDRAGTDVIVDTATGPAQFSGAGVNAEDAMIGADDQFGPVRKPNQQWRTPGFISLERLRPYLFAAGLIQGHEFISLDAGVDDHAIFKEDR